MNIDFFYSCICDREFKKRIKKIHVYSAILAFLALLMAIFIGYLRFARKSLICQKGIFSFLANRRSVLETRLLAKFMKYIY